MIFTEFKEANGKITAVIKENSVVIEKPIQCFINMEESSITFCAKLNKEEISQIYKTGYIYLKQGVVKGNIPLIYDSVLKEDNINIINNNDEQFV